MPSPLLQLRIPQDLADWLEAKYPSRGEVAEYVRQLLTAEQMKEAVAPLVPETTWTPSGTGICLSCGYSGLHCICGPKSRNVVGANPPFEEKAEPKPKARRKKQVGPPKEYDFAKDRPEGCLCTYDMLGRIWNSACEVHDSASDKRTQTYVAASTLPQRCNRGACTGTIKPNGRCIRCNQEPLKESK
jgi:hypothetical protein